MLYEIQALVCEKIPTEFSSLVESDSTREEGEKKLKRICIIRRGRSFGLFSFFFLSLIIISEPKELDHSNKRISMVFSERDV